jgi:STE24 endopeptidase
MEQVNIDQERQKQAKQYARINRRLMLVNLAISTLYALAWLVFGWSSALKNGLLGGITSPWLLVPIFALIFGGVLLLINLPLSYYEGYVLPHRFGMSNQTLSGWISDEVKGGLISAVFGVIIIEIVYLFLRVASDTWWLWTALVLLVFTVLLSNLAPVLIFPLFYKTIPLGEEYAGLSQRLMALFAQAGARVQGVYQFDMSRRTKAANAALTGLGATRRIILGDTLLKEFTPDEVETVMAHELGHHVNKDIPTGIIVESLITLVGLFLANLGLQWGVGLFKFEGVWDIAALPLFMLVMGLYGLITMPLTNGYSRWRESRADEYALKATRKPAAFASAMTRLANQNLSDVDPEPWVEALLYSHPALSRRIRMAQEFEKS